MPVPEYDLRPAVPPLVRDSRFGWLGLTRTRVATTVSSLSASSVPADDIVIRRATADDLDALVALEDASFTSDRLSRRSFRKLIGAGSAVLLVAEDSTATGRPASESVRGYALLLFRAGTGLARLYSVAVAAGHGGRGLGRRLLEAAERAAIALDKVVLRLEVGVGNRPARALYARAGYRCVRRLPGYYENGEDGLRLEKPLRWSFELRRVAPYYAQSTEFTCGPACLMMALARYGVVERLDPVLEVRLWREATTIFMGSGLGGCEPVGMAVAAAEAGLRLELHLSSDGPLLLQTVTNTEKRRVMMLAQQDFAERAARLGIVIRPPLDARAIADAVQGGAMAIVLISGNRMYGQRMPHWVVVHHFLDGHFIVHDPWVVDNGLESITDAMNIPIPLSEFDRMSRFGKRGLRAALMVFGRLGEVPLREPAIMSDQPLPLTTGGVPSHG
ncbi:MAG: GNAT family N-acetyltransferase/peptidase C39 family protein [Burkholderiaceae bacterium]